MIKIRLRNSKFYYLLVFTYVLMSHGENCFGFPPKKIYIASVYSYYDLKLKTNKSDILPFAVFENGKHTEIGCNNPSEDSAIGDCECKNVLETNKKWTVFYNGQPFSEILENKIEIAPFECSSLITGESQFDIPENTINERRKETLAYNYDTTRTTFINFNFIGASGRRFSKDTTGGVEVVTIDKEQVRQLKEVFNEKKSIESNRIEDSLITTDKIYKSDLDGDGIPEYMTTYAFFGDSDRFYAFIMFHIWNGKVSPFYIDDYGDAADAWGEGYKFIDAIDIDGDGKKEIFMETTGYEDVGINIYKFKDRKLKLVFETSLFGC
jgi:hypothetical protein